MSLQFGYSAQNNQFVWNSNVDTVCVMVKRMFPAGDLDSESKIRF